MAISGCYLLKKFPGKGGWTYAEIPEIDKNPENPFGWVKVSGFIDSFKLNQVKLMPLGNGKLFLPVKADIRKKIKKEAGDHVDITLEIDESAYRVPREILECLENEPGNVLQKFNNLSEGEQKAYIDWIYAASTDQTRVSRIVQLIDDMSKGTGFYKRHKRELK